MESRFLRCFREPVNGLTHLAGLLASLVALGLLVRAGLAGGAHRLVPLAVFGVSLVVLYLASTLYHSLPHVPRHRHRLRRLRQFDHIAIYGLIAGTYTPVAALLIGGTLGTAVLVGVWAVALLGAAQKIWWMHAPEWLSTGCYLAMGWAGAVIALPTLGLAPPGFWVWIAVGGLSYTVGAVVFGLDRPHLVPGILGAHELWHLCVLAGSGAQFWAIYRYLATG